MTKRFPEAAAQFCYFHLAKNLWLHVQKKGLLPLYKLPEVRALLRSFAGLAFLPDDEVRDGYEELCGALSALVPSVIPRRYVKNLNSKKIA